MAVDASPTLVAASLNSCDAVKISGSGGIDIVRCLNLEVLVLDRKFENPRFKYDVEYFGVFDIGQKAMHSESTMMQKAAFRSIAAAPRISATSAA